VYNDPREAQAAWYAAFQLADQVARGGLPQATRPTVLLRPGEVQHGQLTVNLSSYFSMDVEYTTGYVWGGGLLSSAVGLAASAASNAAAKSRAQRMAQAQWRSLGQNTAVITNQRLLVTLEYQWHPYELDTLIAVQPDLHRWSVVLNFDGVPPMMLAGPWTPWLVVVISASLYRQPWPPGFMPPVQPALNPTAPQPPSSLPNQPPTGSTPPVRPQLPPGPG